MGTHVAAGTRSTRRAVASTAGALAAFAAAVVVQLVRQGGARSWDTIWAEDGRFYYSGTASAGRLLHGYAGYLQLLPRLFGYGGHALPIEYLAPWYAIGGAVVGASCALVVWWCSGDLVPHRLLRVLLASSVVLLPTLVVEQLANGVDTNWPILFAGWWAILFRPRSTRAAMLPAVVVFLAVTSNALALLFAPVVLALAWRRRDRPALTVLFGYAAGSAVQLAVIATSPRPETVGATSVGDLPKLFAVRVLGSSLVGEHWVGDAWSRWGDAFAVVAVLVSAVGIGVLVAFATNRARLLGLPTMGYGALVWGVAFYGRGTADMRLPAGQYLSPGARFSSFAIWMLFSGACILVSSARPMGVQRVLVVLVVAHFALVAAVGFRDANGRSDGPLWSHMVRNARAQCAGAPPTTKVMLSVSPPVPGWGIPTTCRELRR